MVEERMNRGMKDWNRKSDEREGIKEKAAETKINTLQLAAEMVVATVSLSFLLS